MEEEVKCDDHRSWKYQSNGSHTRNRVSLLILTKPLVPFYAKPYQTTFLRPNFWSIKHQASRPPLTDLSLISLFEWPTYQSSHQRRHRRRLHRRQDKVLPHWPAVLQAFKWSRNRYPKGFSGSSLMHRNMILIMSKVVCGLPRFRERFSWYLRVMFALRRSFSPSLRKQRSHGESALLVFVYVSSLPNWFLYILVWVIIGLDFWFLLFYMYSLFLFFFLSL